VIAPVLGCRDVRLVAEWFRDVLGFDLDGARVFTLDPGEGPSYAIVERDGMEVHLQIRSVPEAPRDPNAYDSYARVPDAAALLEEFLGRSVVVVQPLETQPYGMLDFSVRSPEGHVLMFGSPAV
jgi:hypothetical protein